MGRIIRLDMSDYDPQGLLWAPLQLARWVGWKYETRGGRKTKVPMSVKGGHGSSTDPTTWGTREEAGGLGLDGIGYVLGHVTSEHEYICGIDLDGCLDPECLGSRSPSVRDELAAEILLRFKTYAEISPSGSGVHLLFTVKEEDILDLGLKNRRVIRKVKSHDEIALDVSGRYYTFTGNMLDDGNKRQSIRRMSKALMRWLLRQEPLPLPHEDGTRDESGSGFGLRYMMSWYGRHGDDYYGAQRDIKENRGRAGEWARRVDDRQLQRAWEKALEAVDNRKAADGSGTTPVDEVTEEAIGWLRPGWPRGTVVLVAGQSGVGKSTMLYDLIARISSGREWPTDGPSYNSEAVLMINFEDPKSQIIKPRLRVARADMSKVFLVHRTTEDGRIRPFSIADDLRHLERHILQHDAGLVVIDPVSAFMGRTGRDNSRSASDVRATLDPLAELSERTGVTIVLVSHFRKGAGSDNPLDNVVDSQAYTALPRVVWMMGRDPEDTDHIYMMTAKNQFTKRREWCNYGFELADRKGVSQVRWDTEPVGVSLRDIFSPPKKMGRPSTASHDAKDFLKERLEKGPVPVTKILGQADKYNLSRRTLYRARDDLEVVTCKIKGEQCWKMPLAEDE